MKRRTHTRLVVCCWLSKQFVTDTIHVLLFLLLWMVDTAQSHYPSESLPGSRVLVAGGGTYRRIVAASAADTAPGPYTYNHLENNLHSC